MKTSLPQAPLCIGVPTGVAAHTGISSLYDPFFGGFGTSIVVAKIEPNFLSVSLISRFVPSASAIGFRVRQIFHRRKICAIGIRMLRMEVIIDFLS
jgi:hypothetical protein